MIWDVSSMTAGIRAGDEVAFDAFYERYSGRMLHYLLVATRGDELLAREVHQEALLRVVRHVKPMDSDEGLWGYLALTMRSAWIDLLRARRQQKGQHHPLSVAEHVIAGPEDETLVDDRLQSALAESIQRLPESDRHLVVGHYLDGRSQASLAADLAVPLKTVSMRLVRLRRRLRDLVMEALGRG